MSVFGQLTTTLLSYLHPQLAENIQKKTDDQSNSKTKESIGRNENNGWKRRHFGRKVFRIWVVGQGKRRKKVDFLQKGCVCVITMKTHSLSIKTGLTAKYFQRKTSEHQSQYVLKMMKEKVIEEWITSKFQQISEIKGSLEKILGGVRLQTSHTAWIKSVIGKVSVWYQGPEKKKNG